MKKLLCSITLCVLLLAAALTACGSANNDAGWATADTAPRDAGMPTADSAYSVEAPMMGGGNVVTGGGNELYAYEPGEIEYAVDDYDMVDMEEAYITEPAIGYEPEYGADVDVHLDEATRKIVYTVNLNMQTLDFDAGVPFVESLTAQYGGYIESSSVYGTGLYDTRSARSSHYTLRIPAETLDDFVQALDGEFNITYNNRYTEDISDRYYDVEARLNSLRAQEASLLSLLEQADSVEYLIEVQRELSSVRYQIESLTSSILRMDSQVSMSTVTLTLEEVLEYEQLPELRITFGERIGQAFASAWRGFVEFCQDALLTLIVALPFVILLVVLAVVLFLALRRRRKARRAAAAPQQPSADPPAAPEAPPAPAQPEQPTPEKPGEKPE